MCILYNQRDATYTMLFIIISALHVSDGFFRPSSGAYKTVCAEQFQPNHASGTQQESMTIPKAAHTVL